VGSGRDEQALMRYLRDSGVKGAVAQYWVAYRLTFLFNENPIVFPIDLPEDRYPPYRKTPVKAFILDPREPRLSPDALEQWLKRQGLNYRRDEVGRFIVFKLV